MPFSIDYSLLPLNKFHPTHVLLMVSVTAPGQPTIRSWFDAAVHKLIRLIPRTVEHSQYLRITKLGSTPKDTWKNYVGLNPRVEICTPSMCRKQVLSQWQMEVRIPKCPEGHNIIFQIMDKEDDGKTPLPTFQLIVRKGVFNIRTAEITPEGKRGLLVYKPLCNMDQLWGKWFTVTVEGVLDYNKGYFNVALTQGKGPLITDVRINTPKMPTASRFAKPVKMAYGVYGYPGPDFSLDIKKVSYKII